MYRKINRILITAALAAAVFFAGTVRPEAAVPAVCFSEENETDERGGADLKITVIENIPAADIEEDAVPLAAPQSSHGLGMPEMLLMAFFGIMVLFIAATCIRRARLRKQFAGYENDLLEEWNTARR